MRYIAVFFMALAIFVSGCALLDSLAGVQTNPDGSRTAAPGGGVVGTVGSTASGFPGWIGLGGTALSTLAALYQSLRVRQYRQGMQAVVTGVDAALEKGTKLQVTKDELYKAIGSAIEDIVSNPSKAATFIADVKAVIRAP